MEVLIEKQNILHLKDFVNFFELQGLIAQALNLRRDEFYLLSNGKLLKHDTENISSPINVVLTTLGGKGGFGSMLRAIGAQIEKTTNREACRDLSGRRLRDINEEQRLKKWVAQQAEREKEAKEKRKKKLEKLCEQPKHEFSDQEYDKERSALPEKVEDAVTKGLEVSCKRRHEDKSEKVPKKKKKLWVDNDLEDLDSSEDISDEEDNKPQLLGECSTSSESTGEFKEDNSVPSSSISSVGENNISK